MPAQGAASVASAQAGGGFDMIQPWPLNPRLYSDGQTPAPSKLRRRMAGLALNKAVVVVGLIGLATWASAPAAAAPPLPLEQSDTAVLPPSNPHRFFLLNAFGSGLTTIIDGDDAGLRTIGTVPGAWNGIISLSHTADKIYVAETYWSHGNRGQRADMLTVYDGTTLKMDREIALPGRFIVNPKTQQLATSDDGELGYVYDMVPASAIHVVDLVEGKLLTSVDIPGCALAYAYGKRSFATVCGDGTIGVVTVPPTGTAKAVFSKPFFKANEDPVFDNSVVDRTTGEGWLMTYSGHIFPVQLGATAVVGKPWSITVAAGMPDTGTGVQELAWRPGGAEMLALHRADRQLYVLMHPGNYWTQKANGTEVWVLDGERHTLIRRIKLDDPGYGIIVTQDEKPLLFVIGSGWSGTITAYDATTGEKLRWRTLRGIFGLAPGL
jgi:methylamine dehydrogenase heavy chain